MSRSYPVSATIPRVFFRTVFAGLALLVAAGAIWEVLLGAGPLNGR